MNERTDIAPITRVASIRTVQRSLMLQQPTPSNNVEINDLKKEYKTSSRAISYLSYKNQLSSFPFCHHRQQESGEYKNCGFCRGLSLISEGVGSICGCFTQPLICSKNVSYQHCRSYKRSNLVKLKSLNKRAYCRQSYCRPKPYDRPSMKMNPYQIDKMGVLYGTSDQPPRRQMLFQSSQDQT